jgi:hypothetical protein
MFLIHPALESQEMKQITIDHPNFGAQWRAEESEYFCSEALVKKLKENKIELVNWKSPVVLNHWGA